MQFFKKNSFFILPQTTSENLNICKHGAIIFKPPPLSTKHKIYRREREKNCLHMTLLMHTVVVDVEL